MISYWKKVKVENGEYRLSLVRANKVSWKGGVATPFSIGVRPNTPQEDI